MSDTAVVSLNNSTASHILIAFVKDIIPLQFSCYYVLPMSHTTH